MVWSAGKVAEGWSFMFVHLPEPFSYRSQIFRTTKRRVSVRCSKILSISDSPFPRHRYYVHAPEQFRPNVRIFGHYNHLGWNHDLKSSCKYKNSSLTFVIAISTLDAMSTDINHSTLLTFIKPSRGVIRTVHSSREKRNSRGHEVFTNAWIMSAAARLSCSKNLLMFGWSLDKP